MGVGPVGKEKPASFLRTFINKVGEGLKIVFALGEDAK